MAGQVEIHEAEKVQILGELRVVALAKPRIAYEAEFRHSGKDQELVVQEDGSVLNERK